MKRLRAALICLVSVMALAQCATPTYRPVSYNGPAAADWVTAAPGTQGMDPARLSELVRYAQGRASELQSILVIRHGKIVLEKYFGLTGASSPHYLASATKSFTSALVGIAIDKGLIAGVDARVLDFFPGRAFANTDERKRNIRIRDVLSMSSGLDWPQYGPNNINNKLNVAPNWVQFILDRPMAKEPGVTWNYSQGDAHLVSALITRVAGRSTLDFAREYLFEPLGMGEVGWFEDPQGITLGCAAMSLTSRDMARLGLLYLNKGVWNGHRVVSEQWIEESWKPRFAYPHGPDTYYGYFWWIRPSLGLYEAWGSGGERIGVFPELDIVTVTTASMSADGPLYDFFTTLYRDYVIAAVVR
jgi:CubicO group peptidase (beta-lactamase class C family)